MSAVQAPPHPIEARGGIGNCVNAACAAQVSGRPLRWRATGHLQPDDLFENPEALDLCEARGDYVWTFPNVEPGHLGTPGHFPNHEGFSAEELAGAHWSGPRITGSLPNRLVLRHGLGQTVPEGTIGVHVRTHHPEIACDVVRAAAIVNALTEKGPVFLASDTQLPGLSAAVIRSVLPRPADDDDRSRPAIESALHDWFTLGRCREIHRVVPTSTFVDYWCFAARKPMHRLFANAPITA